MARVTRERWLSKKEYQVRSIRLREKMTRLQMEVKTAPFKVLLIFAGPEGAGRGSLLRTMAEWLDPRGVETFSYHPPTQHELEHPHQWRFWRSLPGLGRIGLYAGSWYTEVLREQAKGRQALTGIIRDARRIREFEQLLADGGTLIVKIWLHLSKQAQGKRLRALRADPALAWRVTDEDWHNHQIYDRLARSALQMRTMTTSKRAPWSIIDAEDERARDLAVAELLVARFKEQQKRMKRLGAPKIDRSPRSLRPSGLRELRALPLDYEYSESDYSAVLEGVLGQLNRAVRGAIAARRSIVFLFEGWDAAGKGGVIRRLTSAIDPRDYDVISVAKPSDEEKHAHYLWRFWRKIPRAGRIAVFDRSWYGRVLVERVEGFCRVEEWKRAYDEINDFEAALTAHGTIVLKYWLQISHEEQLRRFRAREATPHKAHKLTEEDWRNRAKRKDYEIAVGDMLALTSKRDARWKLIPAENKRYARLEVLRSATRRIEAALKK